MSLRYVLLAMLSMEPNTGYGLGRLLRGEMSHVWNARLQQIYTELSKLERSRLAEAKSVALPKRPVMKVYSITTAGGSELDRWLLSPPEPRRRKDSLLARLYCLERMGMPAAVQRIEERLAANTARIVALEERRSGAMRSGRGDLGKLIAIEAALAHAEAEVAWCSRALDYLSGPQSGDFEPSPGERRGAAT